MLYKNLWGWKLLWKINIRLMLDGVAAWKAIFSGDTGFFFAVCKAHVHFVGWMIFKKKPVGINADKKIKLQGLYEGCIAWDYFIKKKKIFSQIVGNK